MDTKDNPEICYWVDFNPCNAGRTEDETCLHDCPYFVAKIFPNSAREIELAQQTRDVTRARAREEYGATPEEVEELRMEAIHARNFLVAVSKTKTSEDYTGESTTIAEKLAATLKPWEVK